MGAPSMENTPANPPIDRIQENVLARAERRLLTWLCARLPRWVTPDMLTFTAMAAAFVIFGAYIFANFDHDWLWLAIASFAVHWFGDSLDGSLARYRGIERPRYGYFLDHSCDGLATLLVLLGIGLSPFVHVEVAMLAVAGYLLLSIHAFLSVRVLGEMKLSYGTFGPTEVRLLLVGFTLAMLIFGESPGYVLGLTGYDIFVLACSVIMLALFVIQTWTIARRLSALEPSRNGEWRGKP